MEIVKYEVETRTATYLDESTEVIEEIDITNFQEASEGLFVNPELVNATFSGGVLLGTGEMITGSISLSGGISISAGRVINPGLIQKVGKDLVVMLNATIHNLTPEDVKKLKK